MRAAFMRDSISSACWNDPSGPKRSACTPLGLYDRSDCNGGAMKHTSTIRFILTGTLVSTSLMLYSCGGDSGPREGTPAFYWAGAKENFAARDYLKTTENLARITATDNEYTARARTWQLALTSGIARGYQDL